MGKKYFGGMVQPTSTRNLVAIFQQLFLLKQASIHQAIQGGPAMGSRGVPVKQMPVNLGPPPPKAKAPPKARAEAS